MSEDFDWHMKPTNIPPEMFKKPLFCADALRSMVANCLKLHASERALYTDGERKVMLAAAEHLENLFSGASAVSNGERS